jgi:hypothetical protein
MMTDVCMYVRALLWVLNTISPPLIFLIIPFHINQKAMLDRHDIVCTIIIFCKRVLVPTARRTCAANWMRLIGYHIRGSKRLETLVSSAWVDASAFAVHSNRRSQHTGSTISLVVGRLSLCIRVRHR